MDTALADEEFARALQAMDNGLRKRKRSISVNEEFRRPRSRKSDTPSRKGKANIDTPSSPQSSSSQHSASSPASETQEHVAEVPKMDDSLDDSDLFCLACGKILMSSPTQSGDVVAPSKENHLICGACFVRYSLTPYKAHAVVKASPSHRCEGHGCAVTFITAERLRDHYHRVHGIASKVA